MAVKIKLKRIGKIRVPQYRIVVADARTARSGRAIEELGLYHPKEEPSLIRVDSDRVQYWLSVGAQPTEPVMAILKVTGDWQKFRGEPGAEGTLKVAEAKVDRKQVFAAAAKEAVGEKDRVDAARARAAKKAADARVKGDTSNAPAEGPAAPAEPDAAAAAQAPAPDVPETPAAADAPAVEDASSETAEAAAPETTDGTPAEAPAEPAADEAKAEG